MDNLELEQEIKDKSLTAPRITLDRVKNSISEVDYVTYVAKNGKILRWAVLTLENGFIVTGEPSAAVSKENDNEEIGKKIAYDNAFDKIWALEGYLLQEDQYRKFLNECHTSNQ